MTRSADAEIAVVDSTSAMTSEACEWTIPLIRLSTIAARLAEQYPDSNIGRGVTAVPLQDELVGDGVKFISATAVELA